jgi:hypothetical protein
VGLRSDVFNEQMGCMEALIGVLVPDGPLLKWMIA